jgi:Skp family chaperone for outer membrane proteins
MGALLLAMGAVFTAHAENIVVLDVVEIVNQTKAHKRAEQALLKERDKAQSKIEKLEKPLIEKRRRLEERRSMLSQEQFLEEQADLRKEVRQFRAEAQSIQEALQREILKRRKEIVDAINSVVAELAKEKGYEVVLPQNVLLYAADSVDISGEVLKRTNQKLGK